MWVRGVHSYRSSSCGPKMSWDKPLTKLLDFRGGGPRDLVDIVDPWPASYCEDGNQKSGEKTTDFGCIVHLVNTGVFNYRSLNWLVCLISGCHQPYHTGNQASVRECKRTLSTNTTWWGGYGFSIVVVPGGINIVTGCGHGIYSDNMVCDRMRSLMTWHRIAIRIEPAFDGSLGRATVQSQSRVVQQRLEGVLTDGTKKMYRSSATVMSQQAWHVCRSIVKSWGFCIFCYGKRRVLGVLNRRIFFDAYLVR